MGTIKEEMMYKDGCKYYDTYYWYDSEDNDFCINVVWKFEKSTTQWHLQSVELEDYSQSLPQGLIEEVKWLCGNDREIWREIEKAGPSENLEEVR